MNSPPAIWDCVVVGAGPAGLSAAIYMARFRRTTLVIDDRQGRWVYGQRNDNYLGFPRGVSALRLHRLGTAQATHFGAVFATATVDRVGRSGAAFLLRGGEETWRARTVIWASGVRDRWPSFPGAWRLVGKRLFWCIVCDGWRTLGQPILLVADDDKDVLTALQFLTYTPRVTLLVPPGAAGPSRPARRRLERHGIGVLEGAIRRIEGLGAEKAEVSDEEARPMRVWLRDGRALDVTYIFGLLGSVPRVAPLAGLDAPLDERGCLITDEKGRTAIAGLFAAGDATNQHSHQVVAAAHEGSMAAVEANQFLYPASTKARPGARARGRRGK